jgi:adenylate cyclase
MTIRRYLEFMHHRRVLLQTAFVVVLTAFYFWFVQSQETLLENRGTWIENIENDMLQVRLQKRPPLVSPTDVVVIAIDGGTFDAYKEIIEDKKDPVALRAVAPELNYFGDESKSWPFDNGLWAKLTDRLLGAGANFVAYDFVLYKSSPEGDAACADAFTRNAEKVAIASDIGGGPEGKPAIMDMPDAALLPKKAVDIVGLSNQQVDPDGMVRRIAHARNIAPSTRQIFVGTSDGVGRLRTQSEYSLSWLAAKKSWLATRKIGPEKNIGIEDPVQTTDPNQPTLLNYYALNDPIKTIPLWELLADWDTVYDHGEYFRGKTVFIGPTAESRFRKRFFDTPADFQPQVQIQATAFANLIHGDSLRPASDFMVLILILGLGFMALMVSLWMRAVLLKIVLFFALAGIFFEATQHIFTAYDVVTPVAGAAIILLGCGAFGTLYDYLLEQHERQRTLDTFESMVSPGVAGLVLSHRGDLEKRLGGQRQEVVVLFGDIRNFTKMSEKLEPETLVAQLNEYLERMVGIIQDEGGTLQKYIGDAVMAAWGDVRVQPAADGAHHAVQAALRMQSALKQLNEQWLTAPNREQLKLGIGLNHGEGIVGRIGHPRRMEFTVLGDAVNLAARLESATKQYRQAILVGESIYEMTKDRFLYRFVDKLVVQGKTTAVRVYTPLANLSSHEPPPAGLSEYNAALEQYYARDFAGATETFQLAKEKFGGADFLCDNFLARCNYYFRYEPPPQDWDGTWQLTEK